MGKAGRRGCGRSNQDGKRLLELDGETKRVGAPVVPTGDEARPAVGFALWSMVVSDDNGASSPARPQQPTESPTRLLPPSTYFGQQPLTGVFIYACVEHTITP